MRAVLRGRHAAMMESEPTVVRVLPTPAPSGATGPTPRAPTPVSQPAHAPDSAAPGWSTTQGTVTVAAIGPPPDGASPAAATGPLKGTGRGWRAALGAAAALLAGLALLLGQREPPARAVPAGVALHFIGLPTGGSVRVGSQTFTQGEALVPRSATAASVRVEAPGLRPVMFTVVPDREQRVLLPAMVPEAVVDAGSPAQVVIVQQTVDAGPPPDLAADGEAEVAAARVVRRASGRLTVGADPPRCEVSVDGRVVGRSPVFNRAVTAGEHRVRCLRPDGRVMQRVVRVPAGRETEVIFPAE